jgi:hypothetical protein
MDDVTKTKYAGFLETMIKTVMRYRPDSIAVNMILPDDAIVSGYFKCCTNNKLTIAASLFRDAVQESIEEKEGQE